MFEWKRGRGGMCVGVCGRACVSIVATGANMLSVSHVFAVSRDGPYIHFAFTSTVATALHYH